MIIKIEKIKAKKKGVQVNTKEKEKEEKKIKLLLDDMLDFLAEIPVDKYHDYRNFRNLRLRGYLINKFMREKYARKVTRSARTKMEKYEDVVSILSMLDLDNIENHITAIT
jgi:hypothetical protein